MPKYIHYCWFGGKPLPKLAKKCLKSWKKYLPDYEIIEWNEENIDINECVFAKEAYKNKKWAFVADYARAKILNEYGGIYFDTDMEITKDITTFLDNETFLGVEDSGMVACGVWWEKNSGSFLSKEVLNFYNKQNKFPVDDLYSISIPRILTNILVKLGLENSISNKIQILDKGIYIYPREYFYPLSYNHQNNLFTDNTCMIHYYDGSWTPKWLKRENKILRILGEKQGYKFIEISRKVKKRIKQFCKIPIYPIILIIRNREHKKNIEIRVGNIIKELEKLKDKQYIAFYHRDWLGTSIATKELFEHTVSLPNLCSDYEIIEIAKKIAASKLKLIIFSSFSKTWEDLVLNIKKINPDIEIKILWHGSNAMHIEDYDWQVFKMIFSLLQNQYIKSIGFVKKSMYDLYKEKGYKVEFVMNSISLEKTRFKQENRTDNNIVKIGIYASGDRWVKNFYNQLAAASLIKNCEIDCIPLSSKTTEFSEILKVHLNGSFIPLNREELLSRLSNNNINIYTTFTECAPLLPLESLELGVPCITGNNHHYWENTELEKYLVVNKIDDPYAIYNQILLCLENKELIINLYKKWKKNYDKECEKNVKTFLK